MNKRYPQTNRVDLRRQTVVVFCACAISLSFQHAAYGEDWVTASFYRLDTKTLASRIQLTNVQQLDCGWSYQTIERSTKKDRDEIRRRAATGDYEAIQLLGWFDPKRANLYSAMFGDLNDLANYYGGLNWFEAAHFRRVFKKLDQQVEKGDVDAAIRLYKFFRDGSFWVHWKGHDGDYWANYYSDKVSLLTSGRRRLPIKLRKLPEREREVSSAHLNGPSVNGG